MAGQQTSLALQDRMTGPLMKIMKAMDATISVMEQMDHSATNLDTRGLMKARSGLQSATAEMERFLSASRTARASGMQPLQEQFTSLPGPIGSATGAVKGFFSSFVGAAAAYLSIQGLANGFQSFVNSSDAYVSTSARLALINDQTQTQAELQDKVYRAAQRSRSGYMDIASSVAKLNMLAEDAFSGNDEALRFSELMGKSFTISGASTQERQAGMYQLTQAMAAGKLMGDEFRSIMENAPMLAQAIADAMGKSKGELKELSSEGIITADIIKSALFGAAGDIEESFKNMPLTFAQAMTMMKNWGLTAFEPLLIRLNQFVNSDAFQVLAGHVMWFVSVFIEGMSLMFDILEVVYTEVGAIGQILSDSWALVGPLIIGAAVALGTYLTLLGLYRAYLIVIAGIEAARAFALGVMTVATMLAAGAISLQTAAQWGLNTALLAFPGTWILLAFVAVIALVLYAMVNWGNQTASVIGFITGLFSALGMFVWNMFAHLWNYLAMFAEFFINLFIDPTYAVKKLIYDLVKSGIDMMSSLAGSFDSAADILAKVFVTAANIAIGGINALISAMNLIPGVDIGKVGKLNVEATTNVLSNGLKAMANNLKAPTSSKDVVSIPRATLGSIPAAFNAGNDFAKKMSLAASEKLTGAIDKVKGFMKGPSATDNPFNPDAFNMGDPMKGLGDLANAKNPTGGKLDSVGKIDKDINIADEDIKLMRDLAEIKSIQNIITLTPQVTFGDTHIREEADIPKIVKAIEKVLEDEMAQSAEGVYGV
ncbi:tape measure protein [Psychrobacillus sp. FJAT-21963]|uniref:tape measure protein n=1 Tax=Psychrobacillus sp. FJAT-21963 TaxID=1712028 RepID=UPI0006F5ECFE|nr:tape measure protein [Psychrobacillus sp. FJAT-21963]KQL37124.1 phage tail tape measure protein [Psychrobacillus sp. FJAT-21963]